MRPWVSFLAASLALGAICIQAHADTSAAPPELNGCRIYRVWDFASGAEQWRSGNNTTALASSGGVLRVRNTGMDPWIQLDQAGGAQAQSYRFIGIKMRSSASGQNQIYFSTTTSPGFSDSGNVVAPVGAGRSFRFYEFDMGANPLWRGAVDALRLDPANGGLESGAEVEIDWIALYQRPARLSPGIASSFGGKLNLPVTNTGGEPTAGDAEVLMGESRVSLAGLAPGKTQVVQFGLPSSGAPCQVVAGAEGRTQFLVQTAAAASVGAGATITDGKWMRLELGPGDGRPARVVAHGTRDIGAGSLDPLASVALLEPDQSISWYEINPASYRQVSGSRATASATLSSGGRKLVFDWEFETPPNQKHGRVSVALRSDKPLQILRFEGPRYLAGDGWFGRSSENALFPGIDYLEAGEPSSQKWHIGDKLPDRRSPHPYWITWPVMAVGAEDLVTGMAWDPLEAWADGQRLPTARFESPEQSTDAPWHLLTLSAPSIPEFAIQGSVLASQPFVLQPGKTIKLSVLLFARQGQTVADVVPEMAEQNRLAQPPPPSGPPEAVTRVCMKAYTETLYDAVAKGWKNHIGLGQTPVFMNSMAAMVLYEALRSGDVGLAERCGLSASQQLSAYVGDSLGWFGEATLAPARALVARQMADGGFGYHLDEGIKAKLKELEAASGQKDRTLGEEGKTNSGLTAREAVQLLSVAEKTGDPQIRASALRAVDRMNLFSVPRGAQTWEVHAHAPDIFASALGIDANCSAYKLTGNRKYLKKASFWAYTGLPFIYGWVPPIDPTPAGVFHYADRGEGKATMVSPSSDFYTSTRKQINPGSTIAVFGTSFFLISWFGQPVQWCGLAWANSAQNLLRISPDPVLAKYATMVYNSATQQQTDKGFLAGTYPDSWNLESNIVNMAFIVPDSILSYSYRLQGHKRPVETDSVGLDIGGRRAVLSSFALIERAEVQSDTVKVRLKYLQGQEFYSCLVQVSRPSGVRVGRSVLKQVTDLKAAREGYMYDETHQALHVKVHPTSAVTDVSVDW